MKAEYFHQQIVHHNSTEGYADVGQAHVEYDGRTRIFGLVVVHGSDETIIRQQKSGSAQDEGDVDTATAVKRWQGVSDTGPTSGHVVATWPGPNLHSWHGRIHPQLAVAPREVFIHC